MSPSQFLGKSNVLRARLQAKSFCLDLQCKTSEMVPRAGKVCFFFQKRKERPLFINVDFPLGMIGLQSLQFHSELLDFPSTPYTGRVEHILRTP